MSLSGHENAHRIPHIRCARISRYQYKHTYFITVAAPLQEFFIQEGKSMENLKLVQELFNAGKLKLSDACWYAISGYSVVCGDGGVICVAPPGDSDAGDRKAATA